MLAMLIELDVVKRQNSLGELYKPPFVSKSTKALQKQFQRSGLQEAVFLKVSQMTIRQRSLWGSLNQIQTLEQGTHTLPPRKCSANVHFLSPFSVVAKTGFTCFGLELAPMYIFFFSTVLHLSLSPFLQLEFVHHSSATVNNSSQGERKSLTIIYPEKRNYCTTEE